MEYRPVDIGLLKETLAGIEFISDTDGDKRKPFGVSGSDYEGMVIATIVRNACLESGWFVSVMKGDDAENATLYGFGLDEGTTVTASTLGLWAVGLHLHLEQEPPEGYSYRVFNLTSYVHNEAAGPVGYVYLNDIPFMTITRGRSGTYFSNFVATEFHQNVHKVTSRMAAIWIAQCTERMRYSVMAELPPPMLTAFSKVSTVLDSLVAK